MLAIIILLVVCGFFIFMSASFGLLTRSGAGWSDVIFSQLVFGLGGGLLAMLAMYKLDVRWLKKLSPYIFLSTLILTALVFVPGIGLASGGARRWLVIAGISIQPSELLKLATIIILSSWYASNKDVAGTLKEGLLPLAIILGLVGTILLLQPDTGTFLVMLISSLAIFLVAGGSLKHLAIICGLIIALITTLALTRPYVKARIATFVDPTSDPLGSSYQLRQSILAIGAGGATGRGFGQSIQKFQYLPEPTGDSIFAVLGEEFGLIGTLIITGLFTAFGLRGLGIARRAPDQFHRLMATGIVIMIISQAYVHIGAMLGIVPLTGIPLPYISHGGTALMLVLASSGVLLQISAKQIKK